MASIPNHHIFLKKLLSKKVLIIGGTTGVGFSVARAVLEYEGIVVSSVSTPSRLETATDGRRSLYPEVPASYIAGKLTNLAGPTTCEAQMVDLLDYALQAGINNQRIDHVVFTAGDVFALVPLKETSPENILKLAQVRYIAAAYLAKHLLDDK